MEKVTSRAKNSSARAITRLRLLYVLTESMYIFSRINGGLFRYIPYIVALNSTIDLFSRNLKAKQTTVLIINLAVKTATKK